MTSDLYDAFNPSAIRLKKQDRLIDKDPEDTHLELLEKISDELIIFRKEYLRSFSFSKIDEWKNSGIFPEKEELGIPEDEYEEIVRDIFVAAPQLFSTTTDDQRRVTLRMLASLLGSEGREVPDVRIA